MMKTKKLKDFLTTYMINFLNVMPNEKQFL